MLILNKKKGLQNNNGEDFQRTFFTKDSTCSSANDDNGRPFLSFICYIVHKYNSEIKNEGGAISLDSFAHKGHFPNDFLHLCITDGFLFYLRKTQFRPIHLSINNLDTSKSLF